MSQHSTVKVSSRNQIALPSEARKKLNIRPGDRLLVDVQDGVLVLIPEPRDYVEYMMGLHREIWEQIDADEHIQRERDAWQATNASTD
ncbi:MAG: AbrB/MazE/SpoVT family DNA-binding domain-containing protein [Chloroflexi bacterium]|nr:AbrB/MazE/SpoVT family DNA-binding domain-containing protein [Chloroflexota bacterium]